MSKFANQLRGWRAKRGWSQAELARKLGYSNALVSQIESESKAPSADFAAKCDEVFDTPATFTDFHELVTREAWPGYFAPVIDSETKATQIHEWDQRAVPGLLQTEDYARSVIKAWQPWISPEELERKATARIARQEIFARPLGAPLYWAVLHEGVLRHRIGSPAIMGGQLDKIIGAADSGSAIIQVLPYSASAHPGTDGPILLFDFASAPSTGYTECNGGGMIMEQPDQVAGLVTTMNLIRAAALSPHESLTFLRTIRDEIQ